MRIFGLEISRGSKQPVSTPTVSVAEMPPSRLVTAVGNVLNTWNGEKYPTGLGSVGCSDTDYWALRHFSGELFKTNMYASGLLKRLLTNEINTGLSVISTSATEWKGTRPPAGVRIFILSR